MKTRKKPAFLFFFVFTFAFVEYNNDTTHIHNQSTKPEEVQSEVIIVSPYDSVDWKNYGQYKAALHTHTTNSDGKNILSEVIEDHYSKGFDILAITDHNLVTNNWASIKNGLSQERFEAIVTGDDRNGKGMLMVPYTNEQSRSLNATDSPPALRGRIHFNTFFANYNNPSSLTLRENIEKVDDLGGISFINHPSWTYNYPQKWDKQIIRKYSELFVEFPSLAGMEIQNNLAGRPNDRILWDNILAQTVPLGRYVWGVSTDDSHSNDGTGYSFTVFVMAESTLENLKAAIMSGNFYAVFRTGTAPVIIDIKTVNTAASITITAENYTEIEWVSGGKIIANGNTINLLEHNDNINSYVRANIIGPGGIIYTQPFGVIWIN